MRRFLAALALLPALAPASASAEFHFVSIREVFPGDSAAPDAEYVELQAYAAAQQFVTGHEVTFRDSSGAKVATESFAKDVADGSNQITMVMATPAAETRFGAADASMSANLIDPSGGAICWEDLDCVAWGNFSGAGSILSPAGSPAAPAGIPDGMALRRSIARGCSTLLEPGDDSNDSAADFSLVFPGPRPNSVPPSERSCGAASGPSAGGAGQVTNRKGAPQTRLKRRPPRRTRDRTPTFAFGADERVTRFECRLDRRVFKPCRSPFTARRLSFGKHRFEVRARDLSGRADPTPAVDTFRVVRR